ncbi:hypothetical protein HK100_010158 [Physocladia obscura]|uniref:Zincin n=1 Tax=Physocladia obscura TaxID=109957 RepID=A0AAD5XH22_9FUNG|nr:hypothetical protein HK100_010158 [Physocladia obscura]
MEIRGTTNPKNGLLNVAFGKKVSRMPNFKKTTTQTTATTITDAGVKKTTTHVKTVYSLIADLAAAAIAQSETSETTSGSTKPRAQDDLYLHANHEWLNDPKNVIPPEYPSWGAFMALRDDSLKNQLGLLKELAAQGTLTVDEAKLVAVWKASLERFRDWGAGVKSNTPIDERLGAIDESRLFSHETTDIENDVALATYLATVFEQGISGPLLLDQGPNFEDSKNAVLFLSGGGLSLPSRDFYFEENYKEKKEKFIVHLNNVTRLVGENRLGSGFADAVLRFETKLAEITLKPTQQRDFTKYYTITTLDGFTSGINDLKSLAEKQNNYGADSVPVVVTAKEQTRIAAFVEVIFSKINLREKLRKNFTKNYPEQDNALAERVLVFDGDYFRRVFVLLLDKENRADLKAYLQYQAIKSVSAYCSKDLDNEFFDMYLRTLRGQKEQKSDEKRTADLINEWIGFLLGKVYVSRYFAESDKKSVSDMIAEVVAVMRTSIDNNDWLTGVTKAAAKEKLDSFKTKIGFPDVWRTYDNLVFGEDNQESLWSMKKKVSAFILQKDFWEHVNTPVDKTEWGMTPQTVNAYYNPLDNEICFPAAIIQPPFYAKNYDAITFDVDPADRAVIADDEIILAATNFGGIASVIAHEITHGFDDQGRQFDSKGNVRDWWTEEDAVLFTAKCNLMEKQKWSFFEAATGKTHWTQPKLTMGENLADLGGISLGIQVLLKRVEERQFSEEAKKAAMRVFFLSYANLWKKKAKDAFMVNQLATDPHSPGEVRANLVKNIDQFYEAFGVKEGDGMYLAPAERVVMW